MTFLRFIYELSIAAVIWLALIFLAVYAVDWIEGDSK